MDTIVVNRLEWSAHVTVVAERGDTADRLCDCPDGFIHPDFAIAPAEDSTKVRSGPWVPLKAVQPQYDTTRFEVRLVFHLTLPPHSVLDLGYRPFWTLAVDAGERQYKWEYAQISSAFQREGTSWVYQLR